LDTIAGQFDALWDSITGAALAAGLSRSKHAALCSQAMELVKRSHIAALTLRQAPDNLTSLANRSRHRTGFAKELAPDEVATSDGTLLAMQGGLAELHVISVS
jgi:hypothetical protein